MTKELEAFEKIKKYLVNLQFHFLEEELDIIETALKNYEKLKNEYDKLESFHKLFIEKYNQLNIEHRKKLKALEIIKEKKVNVNCIISGWSLWKYNSYKTHINLTKEEYELLKEVLINDRFKVSL